MTPDQREAALNQEWNRMLELGGNIYYTSKLAAFHGINFQQLAGLMTGLGEDYRRMMAAGGRMVDGNRYQAEWDALDVPTRETRNSNYGIYSGVRVATFPLWASLCDKGIEYDDYYGPIFKGFEFKEWMEKEKPDVIFLVYNDHCTGIGCSCDPDLCIGAAPANTTRPMKAGARDLLRS